MNSCVSTTTKPISVPRKSTCKSGSSNTQCFPLYSVLMATNGPRVDYLRLSTDGEELQVLKTIPWEKVLGNIELKLIQLMHD